MYYQGTRQNAPNTRAQYRGVDLETTLPSPRTLPAGDIGRPEPDGNGSGGGGSLRIDHASPVGHRRARNGPDRVPMRVASIFCDALYSEKAYQGKTTGTRSEATDILSAGLWAWARTNLRGVVFLSYTTRKEAEKKLPAPRSLVFASHQPSRRGGGSLLKSYGPGPPAMRH